MTQLQPRSLTLLTELEPCQAQPDAGLHQRQRGTDHMEAMGEDRFWGIIDGTLAHLDDPDEQLQALSRALSSLTAEDVETYEIRFGELMEQSFTWDLWAATYVIHGGAGNDSFDYFRHWLISRGRDLFERAVDDPEVLAKGTLSTVEGICEFEAFSYVASEVWHALKGLNPEDPSIDFPFGGASSGEPKGEPFDEDEEHLSKRLPKLWKRYGEQPLG